MQNNKCLPKYVTLAILCTMSALSFAMEKDKSLPEAHNPASVTLHALAALQDAQQTCKEAGLQHEAGSIEAKLKSCLPHGFTYEQEDTEAPCLYCTQVAEDDEDNLVLVRNENFVIKLSLQPYNPGHLEIIPTQHTESLESMNPNNRKELMEILTKACALLKLSNSSLPAMNAGSKSDHWRFEVTLRSGNEVGFGKLFADKQLVSKSLEAVYDELKPVFQNKFSELSLPHTISTARSGSDHQSKEPVSHIIQKFASLQQLGKCTEAEQACLDAASASRKDLSEELSAIEKKQLNMLSDITSDDEEELKLDFYNAKIKDSQIPSTSSRKTSFAPWRNKYSSQRRKEMAQKKEEEKKKPCPFCTQFAQPSADKENYILIRLKHCVIMFNRSPYNPGHILVLPKGHLASFDALTEDERAEFMEAMAISCKLLREHLRPEDITVGFNFGMGSGGTIPGHLHAQILPQFSAETSQVVGLARNTLVTKYMDELYDELKPIFEENVSQSIH